MPDLILTPPLATLIFVCGCLAGVRFRRIWKEEGPVWQLWVFGLATAAAFLTVGFVPLAGAG